LHQHHLPISPLKSSRADKLFKNEETSLSKRFTDLLHNEFQFFKMMEAMTGEDQIIFTVRQFYAVHISYLKAARRSYCYSAALCFSNSISADIRSLYAFSDTGIE